MRIILLFTFFIICTFTLSSGCEDDIPVKSTNSETSIEFTFIPSYGSNELLKGKVNGIKPEDYKIAVYILVEGYGWVIKPSIAEPLTPVNSDCSFSCNIVTGGVDAEATSIAAFLIPNGTNPPLLKGSPEIPESMFTEYINLNKLRYRRTINFASRDWWVKNTVLIAGPGPNYFSDNSQNVWVNNNRLHLKITKRNNIWYCPEVICKDILDYGNYVFKIESPVGNLDNNVVLGLFTWDMTPGKNHREIDIEFIKACSPNNMNAQYVIQPYNTPGNLHSWNIPNLIENTTHIFEWNQDTINFKSIRGYDINAADTTYQSWSFSGSSTPDHNNENVRINLWLCNGNQPANLQEAEVVIYDFIYSNH